MIPPPPTLNYNALAGHFRSHDNNDNKDSNDNNDNNDNNDDNDNYYNNDNNDNGNKNGNNKNNDNTDDNDNKPRLGEQCSNQYSHARPVVAAGVVDPPHSFLETGVGVSNTPRLSSSELRGRFTSPSPPPHRATPLPPTFPFWAPFCLFSHKCSH